ncbi:MAG: sulfotransferase [Planctomycetota bacterium]
MAGENDGATRRKRGCDVVPYGPEDFRAFFLAPPSFFVVGAQKAGTSTVHAVLAQLPGVSLPRTKETHFFCSDDHYRKGPRWYRRCFRGNRSDAVCGEVDPEYLFCPGAAGRIAAAVPAAKIVVLLREPVERAFSHYLMSVRRGFETLDFRAALEREGERLHADAGGMGWKHHSYLTRGLYAAQIRRYLDLFPRENLLFVRFEDLTGVGTQRAASSSILRHVGLPSLPGDALRSPRENEARAARSRLLSRLLWGDNWIKRAVRPWLPFRRRRLQLAMAIDRWNRRPVTGGAAFSREDVPPEARARLREEAAEVAALTGLDLSSWSERYE